MNNKLSFTVIVLLIEHNCNKTNPMSLFQMKSSFTENLKALIIDTCVYKSETLEFIPKDLPSLKIEKLIGSILRDYLRSIQITNKRPSHSILIRTALPYLTFSTKEFITIAPTA